MKTLFFLKTAKKKGTEPNSVVLRIKLVSTGKYKVKGLAIKCSGQDWDQKEQRVKSTNPEYIKYNNRLASIRKKINDLEEERILNPDDIDWIVEASIKDKSVKELKTETLLLSNIIKDYRDYMEDDPTYSISYKRRLKSVSSLLEKFEKEIKYKVHANDLYKKSAIIQRDIVKFYRKAGKKDSTAKSFLTNVNACIGHYNKFYDQELKHFDKKNIRWAVNKRKVIALNTNELKVHMPIKLTPYRRWKLTPLS